MLGGWVLENFTGVKLPQKVASGFVSVTGGLVGTEYQPVLYVGKQIVNGTNHCVLAIQKLITATPEERLVKVILNESPRGEWSLGSVSGIAL